MPPALAGGKQIYIKKSFSQNRKVWLKPNSNSNKKPPAKAGGNSFYIETKIRVIYSYKIH
ncbi:hypothetical protein [Flavobacterium tyrosinilyticum]|uniref:hypothetical protein n=1 Tax=Flavobacterium tyrosinilyticum TaxID=1658740 RepID=UPI00202F5025|nr:hypothetical protein [Flavobacterium tyrosinilyticum]MCM0668172.1 hypothetical protein [Flavobacterium tyrosinilyticum]